MLEEMLSEEIRDLVRDVIIRLGLYSEDAVELIMLTCANESHLGKFRYLPRKRTCHGIFQMEISGYHTVGGRPSSEEQLHHKGSHGLCEVFTENMRRRGISLEWILLVVPCDKNVVC